MVAPSDDDDEDMKALLEHLGDEDVQQEFAEKLVNRLTDKLSDIFLQSDALQPLDLLDDDTDDTEAQQEAEPRRTQQKIANEDLDAQPEELDAEPVAEPRRTQQKIANEDLDA